MAESDQTGPVHLGGAVCNVLLRAQVDPSVPSLSPDEQRLQELLATLLDQVGPRYSRERTDLAQYRLWRPEQRVVVEAVRSFASAFPANLRAGKGRRGLILYGSPGTGKDHLLTYCLFRAAAAGFRAGWRNTPCVYGDFKDAYRADRPDRPLLNDLCLPIVLGLSDLIPHSGEVWPPSVDVLGRLTDRRQRLRLQTWVTLNVEDEAQAREVLSVPVWDRLSEDALVLPCYWESYRTYKTKLEQL